MNKPRVIAVTIATGDHMKHFKRLKNSLRKFHSEEELPLYLIDEKETKTIPDEHFFYRATPIIGHKFLQNYDVVIKLDADQIITGDISHVWEGDFDVATVLNDPSYPIQLWDIHPYYNNGLTVMKSKEFVKHWLDLCYSEHFDRYQFREQDLLNILCSNYFKYKVKCLDSEEHIYGEFAKPNWAKFRMVENKIMLDKQQLHVIHFGGGNAPDKGNYRIKFHESVVKHIEKLIK